jgi:uncharacterized protein with HEPN domain
MYDGSLLRERLLQVLEALSRIQRRSAGIAAPEDFEATEENRDKLDAIAMMLIAIGENIKKIDRETDEAFLVRYPHIDWRGIKGIRNVLSHNYFDIDAEQILRICRRDVPELTQTIEQMLADFGE